MVLALATIGVLASFTARHPFDYLWLWLTLVGALLAAGASMIALAFGALLVAACAVVTLTNLCLPSETLAWLERRRTGPGPITT
jgi:hypothetical protein